MKIRWLLLSLALLAGCGHRRALTTDELARIREHDPDLAQVRVYAGQRTIAVHDDPSVDVRYAIEAGDVRERSSTRPLRQIVGRRRPGAILATTTLHDMPVLWVSFDPACIDPTCAFPFVALEDGRFVLLGAPELPGRPAPTVYRRRLADRNAMTPTKVGSLADANPVLALERRGDHHLVELEIKKVSRRSRKSATIRARGFDRPSRVPTE